MTPREMLDECARKGAYDAFHCDGDGHMIAAMQDKIRDAFAPMLAALEQAERDLEHIRAKNKEITDNWNHHQKLLEEAQRLAHRKDLHNERLIDERDSALARAELLEHTLKDICAEWNEDCEATCDSFGHSENCKATSIAVAKRALNARAEAQERELVALRASCEYCLHIAQDALEECQPIHGEDIEWWLKNILAGGDKRDKALESIKKLDAIRAAQDARDA